MACRTSEEVDTWGRCPLVYAHYNSYLKGCQMENEDIEKDNKKMTRTDWLLIAVLVVSIADFITRLIKG